jgi:hypothetical protein
MGAWDWPGQLPGAISDGLGNALKGSFGLDRKYNLRFNPKTGMAENVNPDGTATPVSFDKLDPEWQARVNEGKRKAGLRDNEAAAVRSGDRQFQQQLQATQVANAPAMAQITAGIAQNTESNKLLGKRLDADAEQARDNYQLGLKRLGIEGAEAQERLWIAKQANQDANKRFDAQLAIDKQQLEYNREQNWRNGLMQGFALLGKGIAASF